MRWIIAAVFGAALVVSLPMAADAAKKAKGKNLACSTTMMDGKKASWTCKGGEKCCYDWLMAKGTCVAASAACM